MSVDFRARESMQPDVEWRWENKRKDVEKTVDHSTQGVEPAIDPVQDLFSILTAKVPWRRRWKMSFTCALHAAYVDQACASESSRVGGRDNEASPPARREPGDTGHLTLVCQRLPIPDDTTGLMGC